MRLLMLSYNSLRRPLFGVEFDTRTGNLEPVHKTWRLVASIEQLKIQILYDRD